MREIDDISREVHQYLDDLDIITEEIQGKRNYHRRSRCPPQRGKGLHLFRLGKAENNQSLSSRHREYLSGVADWTPVAQNIPSLFMRSRTFPVGSAKWWGYLRFRSVRVISPLRRVIAVSPLVSWGRPCMSVLFPLLVTK
jgi:hypothetical protein